MRLPVSSRHVNDLAYAVADDRLAKNPADKISLPRVRQAEKRFLTHQQVAELAEACDDYRLVVLFLAYTGVRLGGR
jgi:integrase